MVCDEGYIWNPSTCSCERDKLCNIGRYLDYNNCVDKLVEECINVIGGDTMYNETLSLDPHDCPSGTPYVVLLIVFLSISVVISSVFVYFHWYKNKQLNLKNILNASYSRIETKNY